MYVKANMINTISFCNNYQFKQPCTQTISRYQNLQPLNRDMVSFKSANLLTKSSQEITKTIKNIINNDKPIGFGSEGVVYKIPDTEYCVKLMKGESCNYFGNWSFNISSQDRINHIVAKAQNDAKIMKYIKGKPLTWNKPQEIYDLPKETFKNLIIQLKNANDECLKFDNAPSNVIYNAKEKSLTAIDFYEPSPDVDYHFTPLSSIFSVLQNHNDIPTFESDNRKLTGKLLDIVLDEITSDTKPQIEFERYDVFQLIGLLKMYQNSEEAPQMKFLRESLNDIYRLKRLPKSEENNKKINGNTKVARAIIKQVLSD